MTRIFEAPSPEMITLHPHHSYGPLYENRSPSPLFGGDSPTRKGRPDNTTGDFLWIFFGGGEGVTRGFRGLVFWWGSAAGFGRFVRKPEGGGAGLGLVGREGGKGERGRGKGEGGGEWVWC